MMLLYQQIYRVTAGGYKNIHFLFAYKPFVLSLNNSGTYGGFLGIGKALGFKSLAQLLDTYTVIISDKGGGNAGNNRCARLYKHLYPFGLVCNFFCVLGAYNKALTAQNALIADNMCLIA